MHQYIDEVEYFKSAALPIPANQDHRVAACSSRVCVVLPRSSADPLRSDDSRNRLLDVHFVPAQKHSVNIAILRDGRMRILPTARDWVDHSGNYSKSIP